MPSAKEMRKISQAVQEENNKRTARDRAGYKKQLQEKTAKMVKELHPAVLAEVEAAAKKGFTACLISFYKYDSIEDGAKLAAYRQIMKMLQRKPFRYRTKENDPVQGYDGEGNNMSDHYVRYDWTISW